MNGNDRRRNLLYEFISLFFSAWIGLSSIFGLFLVSLLINWILDTTWIQLTIMIIVTLLLHFSRKLKPRDE